MITSSLSLNTLGWIPSGPIDLCASRWSRKSCTSSGLTASLSFAQSWSSNSGQMRSQSLSLVLKRGKKNVLNVSALSMLLLDDSPHQILDPCLLWSFFSHEHTLKSLFYCPPQCWSASTPIKLWQNRFSLCKGKQHPSSPPMSPGLASSSHTFFFCLSSRRRSLLSQVGLLPLLLDFQHFGIFCSCSLRRWSSKTNQHWWTPMSLNAVSQGTLLTSSWAVWNQLSPNPVLKLWWQFSFYYQRFWLWLAVVTMAKVTTYHHFTQQILPVYK